MEKSEVGHLRRLIKTYGPRVVLRECNKIVTGYSSLFISWLNGLQTEMETLYTCLRGMVVPELQNNTWENEAGLLREHDEENGCVTRP